MRRLQIIVFLSFLLAAPSALAAQGTPPSREVVDQRSLGIDGIPITLSPDGAWIAGLDSGRETFCVWNIDTLEPSCDGEVDAVDPATITWAPDSTAVAFSQDSPRFYVDSDIYVFEIANGTLHNLTDDGNAEFSISDPSDEPIDFDIAPSWSPDSQTVAFSRTTYGGEIENPGTILMTIPRSGGEPVEMLRLAPPYPMSVYTTMSWKEDGSILFPVWKVDPTDGQIGIWRTSVDGGIIPVIPGTEADELIFPVIADTQGDALSLISLGHMYQAEDVPFWLSASDGSSLVHLSDAVDLAPDAHVLTAPGFAPSGDDIAFVTREPDGVIALTIGSPDSGEATAVATLDSPISSEVAQRSVDWAENNTIFIGTSDGGTLITLAD